MKIEHEMETRVSRYATVDDALRAVYPTGKNETSVHGTRVDVVSGLMTGTFRVEKPSVEDDPRGETAIATVRGYHLAREYEGPLTYQQVCAQVSIIREWRIPELLRVLEEAGYAPASMSESTAYLKQLLARGILIGTTFHLGMHIVNERFEVQRLLAHADGRVELIMLSDRTVVRPSWHVVVTKKRRQWETAEPPAISIAFGRTT